MIGDDIKLTILAVKGGQVRVGIDAPKNVSIHRQELLLDVKDLNSVLIKDSASN